MELLIIVKNVIKNGCIYVVATPIGNLGDVSNRSIEILGKVDYVAAEDTRNTRNFLSHFQVSTKLISLHEHNEVNQSKKIIKDVLMGMSIAIVSDAGTPAINDPGYRLISLAHQNEIKVIPLPGPCSVISALSVSGLPSDRFCYEGYLPAKRQLRKLKLKELIEEERTMIFLVSVHKIHLVIEDMMLIFGESRPVFLAREMTKIFEQSIKTNLKELSLMIASGQIPKKGEFVVVLSGVIVRKNNLALAKELLDELIKINLSSKAVDIVTRVTKEKRNKIYKLMLEMREDHESK